MHRMNEGDYQGESEKMTHKLEVDIIINTANPIKKHWSIDEHFNSGWNRLSPIYALGRGNEPVKKRN